MRGRASALAAIGAWDLASKRRLTAVKRWPPLFCRHRSRKLTSKSPALTVYFEGSCPLCRAEIAHYYRQDGANQLTFRDVSHADGSLEPDLPRDQAMVRFHVRRSDGKLVTGAAAFEDSRRLLLGRRGQARNCGKPGMIVLLEGAYRLFLPV